MVSFLCLRNACQWKYCFKYITLYQPCSSLWLLFIFIFQVWLTRSPLRSNVQSNRIFVHGFAVYLVCFCKPGIWAWAFPGVSLSLRKWWAHKGGREGKRKRDVVSPLSFLLPAIPRVLVPSLSCFKLNCLQLKSKRLWRRQHLSDFDAY